MFSFQNNSIPINKTLLVGNSITMSLKFAQILFSRILRNHCCIQAYKACLRSHGRDGVNNRRQSHCPFGSSLSRHFRQISSETSYTQRTHLCGDLCCDNVGQNVVLSGWLQFLRQNKFLILRDWKGIVQLLLTEEKKQEFAKILSSLRLESVLEVHGTVCLRPDGQKNEKMQTGEIEVEVSDLRVLNPCQLQLPFEFKDFHEVKESLRMEYRYLDLRHSRLQRNLRVRSQMVMKIREFLANQHGFVEVETPTLFRRTPGGAREFIVPSTFPGKFYSLPQSPQQFKQLLMVGGLDRYFQIARCYRDEGAKPDRQPEFTQIDLEMSFVEAEDVITLVEDMLYSSWPSDSGVVAKPFPRLAYQTCMAQYGCDKPDTRFAWKLQDVKELFISHPVPVFQNVDLTKSSIQALRIPDGSKHLSNKDIEQLTAAGQQNLHDSTLRLVSTKVKESGGLSAPFAKGLSLDACRLLTSDLCLEENDLVFFCAGSAYQPHTVLGKIRVKAADLIQSKGIAVRDPQKLDFLWVLDFPLFLPKEDGGEGLESAHHPFTAPHTEDEGLLYTQAQQVRGQHYDLVLNGQEIGGGSIRIHDARMQRYVLQDILKEDCTQLEHLLSALDSGCPPHGGIALGLDRLLAILCHAHSIRDVIAFPKSHEGRDPMSKAPASVPQADLEAYHIAILKQT